LLSGNSIGAPVSALQRILRVEARRRGIAADELAARIVSIVSTERLYSAVLGEPGKPVQKSLPRRP
jgi:hypothetical protein